MAVTLRDQCAACPWRDMATMHDEFASVVEHARSNPDGFVCHKRMGPCPGPRRAGLVS